MSYANTTACDRFLLEKIEGDEIKNQEASSIFAIWASNKIPTQTIMEYMRVSIQPLGTAWLLNISSHYEISPYKKLIIIFDMEAERHESLWSPKVEQKSNNQNNILLTDFISNAQPCGMYR